MAPSRKAGPSDLLLFERWMETTVWLMDQTRRFPRSVRHSLSQRIETLAIAMLEDITSAAYGRDRSRTLSRADDALNRLRVLCRLAHELGHLSHGQYGEAATRLGEAGRLLGGWRKQQAARGD